MLSTSLISIVSLRNLYDYILHFLRNVVVQAARHMVSNRDITHLYFKLRRYNYILARLDLVNPTNMLKTFP